MDKNNEMTEFQHPKPGSHGLILGKFLPPHRGHLYLIEFALQSVEKLSVVVGSLKREPMAGELRVKMLHEIFPAPLYPHLNILHLTDENPQYPHEDPNFWQIWQKSLTGILPQKPDWVFASDDYGWKLAEVMGAQFMPVDPNRENFQISGTAIRENPHQHWDMLPPPVRRHFLKRVAILGPESTGKSTLAQNLAKHFQGQWVPEYARTWIEAKGQRPVVADMPHIARGQWASQQAIEEQALKQSEQGLIVYDTELWVTTLWNQVLFQHRDPEIEALARRQHFDHYLLCAPDVPWVDDEVRYLPQGGEDFFERCKDLLESQHLPYTLISGSWENRMMTATATVADLLKSALSPQINAEAGPN